jgi:beta-glucosidase
MEKERQALLAAAPKPIPAEKCTPEALAEFAAKTAEGADVIFFVGGLAPTIEGEEMRVTIDGFKGGDRERIELPEIQGKMLKALKATGKPVVFVLCSGSAVALEQNEADYDALVCAWYGGQAGGTAVGDIVSGKVSPSGRLPITFYKSTAQLPDFLDYNMKGRTYRYMTEAPLYPFGYGLSYADFSFEKGKLSSKSIKAGESVTVTVDLKNNNNVASDEIVQVYVKRLGDKDAPVKALKGFQRVSMKGGEKKSVSIELPADSFEYYDSEADDLVVQPGKYEILYGSSSADADLKALKLTVK